MIVTKINDHIAQALARLLQQYKGKPLYAEFYAAFIQQIQDLEDAFYPLDQLRQLFDGTSYQAVGAQLDGIGEIVGISRNGLTDDAYRIFILGKIAANFSDATIATMVSIAATFFDPAQLILHEFYPAEVDYELAAVALEPRLFDVVFPLLQRSLGAAIKLGFVSIFDPTNAFTVGDDFGNGTGGGLGDALNPATGGMLASAIYSNAGD